MRSSNQSSGDPDDHAVRRSMNVVEEEEESLSQDYSSSCESCSSYPLRASKNKGNSGRKVTQQLSELSSLIPGLQKTGKVDEVSIIESAIEHIKWLQRRTHLLEEQAKNESPANYDIVSANDHAEDEEARIPFVEARAEGKNVLLRILCKRRRGHLARIASEIDKFPLSIVTMSSLRFGGRFTDITIVAQMQDEHFVEVKDLSRDLQLALREFS